MTCDASLLTAVVIIVFLPAMHNASGKPLHILQCGSITPATDLSRS